MNYKSSERTKNSRIIISRNWPKPSIFTVIEQNRFKCSNDSITYHATSQQCIISNHQVHLLCLPSYTIPHCRDEFVALITSEVRSFYRCTIGVMEHTYWGLCWRWLNWAVPVEIHSLNMLYKLIFTTVYSILYSQSLCLRLRPCLPHGLQLE